VTVTHPDVERYFMLIPEACQLVLQSAAIGGRRSVMVLDMGEPMKIDDVAKTLISLSGRRDIEIAYTGLRAGREDVRGALRSWGSSGIGRSSAGSLRRRAALAGLRGGDASFRLRQRASETFMRSAALVPMENAR
jgi:hypothetical protein